jgi:hypothetical protein
MWEREPSLPAAVEEAWSRRIPVHDLGDITMSMQTVMSSLYDWKKKHFKSVPRELEKMRKELDELSSLADPESAAKKRNVIKTDG